MFNIILYILYLFIPIYYLYYVCYRLKEDLINNIGNHSIINHFDLKLSYIFIKH